MRGTATAECRPTLAHWPTRCARAARELISRYFPGDYLLTPNGVEVERFVGERPERTGISKEVLFFGRIESRKGLEVLIEAMTFLRDLDLRLMVAGSGPHERHCTARAPCPPPW